MGMAAPKATAKVPAASGRAPAVAGLPATTAPALATATSVTSTAAATDAGVAATAAGAAGDRAKPANVLRIGGLVPLSGGGKVNTGKAIKAAVEMAVRDVAPKRLPGVKVETYFEDTQCGDVPALNAARKLVRNNNVDVMIGDVCSGSSLAATSVANKFQVPLVSPASTSTALSIPGDYFFRTVPSDRYQGQYAAAKMLELGLKTAVVAFTDSSYGQSLAFAFIAAFTRDGGRAYPVAVPVGSRNTTGIMAEIARVQPAGIFIASNSVEFMADLLKAVRAARKNIRIFGGDSLMDAQVAKAAGAANALGVRGSDVSFGSPEFVEAFNEFTKGKGIEYNAKAAHAYDAAVALMEAYRRAPQTKEGPAILAELANVRFQGKSGPIAFDEYGDLKYDPVSSYNVLEFDKAGGLRVLEA